MHNIRFPGESQTYRDARNKLLAAEAELRQQTEQVAAMRRELPLGGEAQNYAFTGAQGVLNMDALFGLRNTLIVYSLMFGEDDANVCPLCSAFMDSLNGQLKHIRQRAGLAVVARSSYPRLAELAQQRGWQDIPLLSAAGNRYPVDYHSETADGAQLPMCNVFVKKDGQIHHYWASELFFVPWESHPRHIDTLWPLWSFFDLTPEGRGDFMPGLEYRD